MINEAENAKIGKSIGTDLCLLFEKYGGDLVLFLGSMDMFRYAALSAKADMMKKEMAKEERMEAETAKADMAKKEN